jgi:hypothetical protein
MTLYLGGGAKLLGMPTGVIINGLGVLAGPTGCYGVVNMGALKEFGALDYKFPSLAILFSHMMDDLSYPLTYGYITYS